MTVRFKLTILFTATILSGYVFGILLTFGSMFRRILEKYQESRSAVASVQAILVGVGMSSGIFCGIFIARLGLWKATFIGAALCSFGFILSFLASTVVHLYFFIGVTAGLGTSIIYLSCTTALGMAYAGPQRVIAIAIQNLSFSVSGIALPYFFNLLVDTYGINGTFLIIGGLCLNCLPAARLFAMLERDHNRANEKAKSDETEGCREPDKTFIEFTKHELLFLKQSVWTILNLPYIFNCLGAGVTVGTVIAFLSLMVDVLSWKGLTDSVALLGFPVAYATGFVARVLAGFARNCNAGQSLIVPTVYTICGCCGFLMISLFSNVPAVLTGCGLTGIAISGVVSASLIVVVHMVDEEHISVGVGLVLSSVGVTTATLGPLFGAMRDSSHSYNSVLLLASCTQFLGVCLYLAAIVSWRRSRKKDNHLEENADKTNLEAHHIKSTHM